MHFWTEKSDVTERHYVFGCMSIYIGFTGLWLFGESLPFGCWRAKSITWDILKYRI